MKKEYLQFAYIGNNIAVDFINTEVVSCGALVDLLRNSADIVRWAGDVGLSLKCKFSEADLLSSLKLRQALKDIVLAKIDQLSIPRKALATINQHLAGMSTHHVLRYTNHEFELVARQELLSIPEFLAKLAYEGAKLLASPLSKQLKRCSNSNCVLVFVDTSRGQKRRWCSMETCGNRAKVATHYRNNFPQ